MVAISSAQEITAGSTDEASLLIIVREPMPSGSGLLSRLAESFAGIPVIIALPETELKGLLAETDGRDQPSIRLVSYAPAFASDISWSLTAADYRQAAEVVKSSPAATVLLLGAEAESLNAPALRGMFEDASNTQCDLVLAHYELPARSGLINSAILYPLSRALFGASPRFPLAIDACLSARMLERMDGVAQRANTQQQQSQFIWPVAEAVAAGFRVGQFDVGPRSIPQPSGFDLNDMINQVVGSCFVDIEAKAAIWQRLRMASRSPQYEREQAIPAITSEEIDPLVEGFRLAYTNLRDVWTLVLPPQTLLGLKRLSIAEPSGFALPDALWARIVYDYLLAFRLRTLNRTHLLGSLTPLYLAWLASHLSLTKQGIDPEQHIQQVAAAFESEKPYLIARWRWPDRFNP